MSSLVMALPPAFDCVARVREAEEPVLIQALITEATVEALDEGVLRWPARMDELDAELQETRRTRQGGVNVRYRSGIKGRMVRVFREMSAAEMLHCTVRYAF